MSENYIVGIGASAGGLEAIEIFFDSVPANSGLSFVVIQHLSPDYESLMEELLANRVNMSVKRVTDKENGQKVLPNHIYLIPPKQNMVIKNGALFLIEQDRSQSLQLPIDLFFESLATDQKKKAIGIVLSGTGSDGTKGIRAIKEAGGRVFVQDPRTAKFDGMPRSAIATGLTDSIASASDLPQTIFTSLENQYAGKSGPPEPISDQDNFYKIINIVKKKTNIDFNDYKAGTIMRRLHRRMSANHVHSMEEYAEFLLRTPNEVDKLQQELFIGVTRFFRDREAFESLEQHVIPKLINQAKEENRPVRVWIAGCSTGEEPYSIAILLKEYIDKHYEEHHYPEVKIFATDIDARAIEKAANGIYSNHILADMEQRFIDNYFIQVDDGYQVTRELREMVIFAKHDIINDPPFTNMDLVSCRNMLIYFQPLLQKKVLSLFRFSLKSRGFLFLGTSETIGVLADSFESIDEKWRIYKGSNEGKPYRMDGIQAINSLKIPHYQMRKPKKKVTADESLLTKIKDYLLTKQLPATLVLSADYQLLYTFGDMKQFVNFQGGKASLNVLELVPQELSIAIATAVKKCNKTSEEITYNGVRIISENGFYYVNLKINVMELLEQKEKLFILELTYNEEISDQDREEERYNEELQERERIFHLEQELHYTRENLQAVIEEQETTNEELQSTNEELVASNEELQSTNEELQSVNEELYTVNTEYQLKINELTELNNDMNNLLDNNDIGTLFLDYELCIRKFTPAITGFINVIESDVGRKFSDLSHQLEQHDLLLEVQEVMDSGREKELYVNKLDGKQTKLTIRPYVTELQTTKGVVLTFINVDAVVYNQLN